MIQRSLLSLRDEATGVRWVPRENLHLTLKFLGELRPGDEQKVEEALCEVTVRPFLLEVGGVGVFPRRGDPRVFWAGIPRAHPHLFQLQRRIDQRLFEAGFEPEKLAYTPHITVARASGGTREFARQWLKHHREYGGPSFRVESYTLFRSEPGLRQRHYRPLVSFPLG